MAALSFRPPGPRLSSPANDLKSRANLIGRCGVLQNSAAPPIGALTVLNFFDRPPAPTEASRR
jgi:hypothetical protein